MLPKPMDPAERKRRDGRFRVAQKDLEGKFSDLINQFMSDSSDGKNAAISMCASSLGFCVCLMRC